MAKIIILISKSYIVWKVQYKEEEKVPPNNRGLLSTKYPISCNEKWLDNPRLLYVYDAHQPLCDRCTTINTNYVSYGDK